MVFSFIASMVTSSYSSALVEDDGRTIRLPTLSPVVLFILRVVDETRADSSKRKLLGK